MGNRWIRLSISAWVGVSWLALGCSSAAPPPKEAKPCEVQIVHTAVIAAPRINPDENGAARPVQVRLYQLKSDVEFRNASFDDIWKRDTEVLGENLVSAEEFPVFPDTRSELTFKRDKVAQYVIAVGLFRTPRGKSWFYTFELPPAPGEEQCGARCTGPDCSTEPVLDPALYLWVEDTTVEDGIEYADYFPSGRVEEVLSTPREDCAESPDSKAPGKAKGQAGPESGTSRDSSEASGSQ